VSELPHGVTLDDEPLTNAQASKPRRRAHFGNAPMPRVAENPAVFGGTSLRCGWQSVCCRMQRRRSNMILGWPKG